MAEGIDNKKSLFSAGKRLHHFFTKSAYILILTEGAFFFLSFLCNSFLSRTIKVRSKMIRCKDAFLFSYACCMLSLLVGCGPRQSTPGQANQITGMVKVDGSSTVYPITEAVAEELRAVHPGIQVTVGISGTGGGMKKFTAGEIDICDASRAIKKKEADKCASQGVGFVELEVAYDGLAVVVNPENDWCDCLTVEQLRELWRPESAVKKWSDLNPEWPQEEIRLYGPGTDSGTFDYFTKAIVGEEKASRADYTASEDDNVLVTGVMNSRYALGYFGYAYYSENKDKLKLLAVDGGDGCVKPSMETVRGLTYKPLSRPLYIYVRSASLKEVAVRNFVDFYLKSADQLAVEVGYVPVSEQASAKNQQALNEALSKTEATP
jgi:phosphate transport system substrate-binding protein